MPFSMANTPHGQDRDWRHRGTPRGGSGRPYSPPHVQNPPVCQARPSHHCCHSASVPPPSLLPVRTSSPSLLSASSSYSPHPLPPGKTGGLSSYLLSFWEDRRKRSSGLTRRMGGVAFLGGGCWGWVRGGGRRGLVISG